MIRVRCLSSPKVKQKEGNKGYEENTYIPSGQILDSLAERNHVLA